MNNKDFSLHINHAGVEKPSNKNIKRENFLMAGAWYRFLKSFYVDFLMDVPRLLKLNAADTDKLLRIQERIYKIETGCGFEQRLADYYYNEEDFCDYFYGCLNCNSKIDKEILSYMLTILDHYRNEIEKALNGEKEND